MLIKPSKTVNTHHTTSSRPQHNVISFKSFNTRHTTSPRPQHNVISSKRAITRYQFLQERQHSPHNVIKSLNTRHTTFSSHARDNVLDQLPPINTADRATSVLIIALAPDRAVLLLPFFCNHYRRNSAIGKQYA